MTDIFLDVGIVLALASALAIIARAINQPLLVGYILAGIIAGAIGLFQADTSQQTLHLLAVFGTTFLLFLVGLELRLSDVRIYGPLALIVGVGQIVATAAIGFLLALLLNFQATTAFYIAIALTFSSTVIIVKLLTDRRDLDSLYGKMTVGLLLVQDAVAIIALLLVTSLGSGGSILSFLETLIRGFILVGLVVFLNKTFLPWLFTKAGRSIEILFITSISWAVIIATLAASLGLSVEIGAFLAGIALANLPQEQQIAARVRPVRDLFVVFFFVLLGVGLTFGNITSLIFPIVVISFFVLIGKPLIVMLIVGRLGFRKRTAFMTAITVAQISEFSLILIALGSSLGKIDKKIVDLTTAVALITILGSSYLITHGTSLYKKLSKYLDLIERKDKIEQIQSDEKEYNDHVVLIGAGRLGWEVVKELQKQKKEILVVEFNPHIIAALKEEGINYLFGDITDPDIFESAAISKADLVISTVFDQGDTNEFLSTIKNLADRPLVFVTAPDHESAVRFYRQGADYVIIPRVLSGHHVAHLLTSEKLADIKKGETREEHLKELRATINQFT